MKNDLRELEGGPCAAGLGGLGVVWRVVWMVVLIAGMARSQGADFSLERLVVAGGGGTSTGGVFTLSGTIGEPAAGGPLTNATFSLVGGFWALPIVVQSTNAPVLAVVPGVPGFAVISWSPDEPGYVLQEASDLLLPAWTTSPSGSTNPVVVPAILPQKYYRLRRD